MGERELSVDCIDDHISNDMASDGSTCMDAATGIYSVIWIVTIWCPKKTI